MVDGSLGVPAIERISDLTPPHSKVEVPPDQARHMFIDHHKAGALLFSRTPTAASIVAVSHRLIHQYIYINVYISK